MLGGDACGVFVVGACRAVDTFWSAGTRCVFSFLAALTGGGEGLGSSFAVHADKTRCAGELSSGASVIPLRAALAGGGRRLVGVVTDWAELAAIGSVSIFV